MSKLDQGYLLISDITGYTAFLSESELEHAEDSLRDLLQLLLDHTRPPLVVSRLEGDAVISYAPAGSIQQGQTFVELIENTYSDFRQARERMVINTSCKCNACRNIPNLDLKFFVHFGTYSFQHLGAHTEMVGTDVNLIHRLTKNHVIEDTGVSAYALYTRAAVDTLGINELAKHMISHAESYEHIGDIDVVVQDLNAVWEREKNKRRIVVKIKEAWQKIEIDLPVEPSIAWDIITNPTYRKQLNGADSQRIINKSNGRAGPGAVYRCAHGEKISNYTIIDWQPLEYLTLHEEWPPPGVTVVTSTHVTPIPDGTRVTWAAGRPKGPFFPRKATEIIFPLLFFKDVEKVQREFARLIERDIKEGRIVVPEAVELPDEDIAHAVSDSLGRNQSV